MKNKKKIYFYVVVIVCCVAGIAIPLGNHVDLMQIISALVAVLGVVLLVVELNQSRKITEVEFIANLNQSFVTNDDYKKAYYLFENYDFENLPQLDLENCHISNYLTFFEVFKLLIDRGTLSIKMLNDLFGYRFFIAVHNPYVQERKLVKSPDNFRNLYILEREWVAYRRKLNMPIFHEEYCLENVVSKDEYDRIVFGKRKRK